MRKAIIFICFCCSFAQLRATHIIGSDASYVIKEIRDNKIIVDVTFTIYRDFYQGGNAGQTSVPAEIEIGVYRRDAAGNYFMEDMARDVYPINFENPRNNPITLQGNQCFDQSVLPMFQTDKTVYKLTNLILDIINEEYRISWQVCCRSGSLLNILNPTETGLVTEVIITPEAQADPSLNSTPVFDFDPEVVICGGFEQEILVSATDADGDELRYFFDWPKRAGGIRGDTNLDACPASDPNQLCARECDGVNPNPINCTPDGFSLVDYETDFSFDNPVTSDVPFSIDEMTGRITGIASANGVYLVGVRVEEWRNGTKIGEVNRDFNLSVTNCNQEAVIGPPNRRADIDDFKLQCDAIDKMVTEDWDPCGAALVRFQNYADADPSLVTFRWTIFDQNGQIEQERNELDWEPAFDLPVGEYIVRFTLFPDLVCEDFCDMQLKVTPPLDTQFDINLTTGSQCEEGPILITAPALDPNATYSWDFGDGTSSTDLDPQQILYQDPGTYLIQLAAERGRCTDTTEIGPIDYFPLPSSIRAVPSQFEACAGTTIMFENLTLSDPNPYTLEWDFDDGKTSNLISPENTFAADGEYQVSLSISRGSTCSRTEIFPWQIDILEAPVAEFTADPTEVTNPTQMVQFTNLSTNASSYEWRFGDQSPSSFLDNPTHQYLAPGLYTVELFAFSPINDCVDKAEIEIPVTAASRPVFPNAFNPLDAQNSEFRATSVFNNFVDYYLAVYDRWGKLVFETNDFNVGWNGKLNNSGSDLPTGVYLFQYRYEIVVGSQTEEGQEAGTVFLVR